MNRFRAALFLVSIVFTANLWAEQKSSENLIQQDISEEINKKEYKKEPSTFLFKPTSNSSPLKQKSVVDALPVSYYFIVIALLAVVIVIIFRQRAGHSVSSKKSPFSMIAQLPLGMKESLQIIDIYGERIVIARTANGIQKIHQVSNEQLELEKGDIQASDSTLSKESLKPIIASPTAAIFNQLLSSMQVKK